MNGYFVFDDIDTRDYDVIILGGETFRAPERDVDVIEIPGRNGTLTLDNGRYINVPIKYQGFMWGNFAPDFGAFKAAMLSKLGYLVLRDSYHSDGFRLARFAEGFEPQQGVQNQSGAFEILFDCYPQFYLDSGQSYTTVANNGTISNPTKFNALPLIQIAFSSTTRNGTVTVNGRTITITGAEGTPLYIDCETQNAYRISSNVKLSQNGKITLDSDFPFLKPGSNTVAYTGNISSVQIMPRWWTL
jgi:Phage-related protein